MKPLKDWPFKLSVPSESCSACCALVFEMLQHTELLAHCWLCVQIMVMHAPSLQVPSIRARPDSMVACVHRRQNITAILSTSHNITAAVAALRALATFVLIRLNCFTPRDQIETSAQSAGAVWWKKLVRFEIQAVAREAGKWFVTIWG